MKYLSVCSGIEAATVAWHGLGWKAAAYSEIEPFPSAVLAQHYPDVPNVGDMTKFKEWNIEPGSIDLLVGGTPCQSFSVAGLRKGLADPRGNLALTYCAILDHLKPRWFVWENVPGVLSSGGGRDFGSFLGAVAELGYGFAYRVLDAQYFGVAQRRRRVFVVGHLGNWEPAAKVLFERESLSGNPAPSREKGKAVAGTITARFGRNGGASNDDVEAKRLIPHGLGHDGQCARALTAAHTATGRLDPHEATFVSQAIAWDEELNASVEQAGTLLRGGAGGRHDGVMQPIPLNSMNALRDADADPSTGCGIGEAGEAMFTITKGHSHAVAHSVLSPTLTASNDPSRSPQSSEITAQVAAVVQATAVYSFIQASDQPKSTNSVLEDMANTLTSRVGNTGFLGVPAPINENATAAVAVADVGPTMGSSGPPYSRTGNERVETEALAIHAMQVRRLTPVECERLQGFPDGYTAIPWRKKPADECPDGPRYKALGNSMAVPVMAWIGKRIQEFEAGNAS